MQRVINILARDEDGDGKRVVYDEAEVRALRVSLPAGGKSAECVVDAPVLLFVTEGEGLVEIEGEKLALKEGDVTVVPAGKSRHLEAGGFGFKVLAVQSRQADRRCGLCSLLESCMSIPG